MTAGQRGSRAAGQDAPSPRRHGNARTRVRLGLITLMIGLGVVWSWDHLQSQQTLATIPVREVTAESIAQRTREARGQVLILSLYRPQSDDPYVVGDLRRWASQTASPGVKVIAHAVGPRRDAQRLFLESEERGIQRLPPEWLSHRSPALDTVLAELGIQGNAERSALPLTAVIDRDGRVTAHWQGSLDYLPVLTAAKAARLSGTAAPQR
jgi:hypothetical protein